MERRDLQDPNTDAGQHAGHPGAAHSRHAASSLDWGVDVSEAGQWGAARNSDAFGRAQSHSGMVRRLRIILPLAGVFILSGLAGAYFTSQSGVPEISVEETAFDNGRLVMRNPALDGVDRDQRPYRLTAEQAVQDPRNPQQVELQSISANVPMPEGLFATITAGTGFYDGDAETLNLGGAIDVVTDDGMTAKLEDADIDMDKGMLRTDKPVAFTARQAVISADSMLVEDNGETVVFERRVRMTIYPDKVRQLQSAQDARTAGAGEQ